MPRKSATPSLADEQAAPGGAAAVDRALSLLCAYGPADKGLSVTALAERTRLYKSTVLRLLASLAHKGFLRKTDDGLWTLGPEVARLAGLYTASFSLEDVLLPVMHALVRTTQESVALHVRQGEQRLCLLRVDSPQLLRDHVRVGDVLPLERGAGGRVLMAFAGAKGRVHARIRQDGYFAASGDRIAGLTGVSAPVWRGGTQLVGALTLTVPDARFKSHMVDDLLAAAAEASGQLANG
jgi:DNA-binding IclR family transcriptional regulator